MIKYIQLFLLLLFSITINAQIGVSPSGGNPVITLTSGVTYSTTTPNWNPETQGGGKYSRYHLNTTTSELYIWNETNDLWIRYGLVTRSSNTGAPTHTPTNKYEICINSGNPPTLYMWNLTTNAWVQASGSGLTSAYTSMFDGVGLSVSSGANTFRLRSASSALTIGVTDNDATYGDNALFTINEANFGTVPNATNAVNATNAIGINFSALGQTIYGNGSGSSPFSTILNGNTTTTKKFYSQTGNGTISAAPIWDVVTKTDVGLSNVENTALSTWTGSGNITTLGTIGTGTWNGSVIPGQYGGTGIANTGKTITLAGNLLTSGAFATTITTTANTNVTLPTSGTLVNTAVTTLSSLSSIGTITTGTWNGSVIGNVYGGTGFGTYAIGDMLYASATNTLSKLAGNVGTASKYLVSTGSGSAATAPVWGDVTTAKFSQVGLKIDDTNQSHTLTVTEGSDLTANRLLNIKTGDQDVIVNYAGPTTGQVLKYTGTEWAPGTDNGGAGGGTVTSVALSAPSELTVGGSPITTSGILALSWTGGQAANKIFATPDASTGVPSLRTMVAGDIPTNLITNAKLAQASTYGVLGNPSNTPANISYINPTTDGDILRLSGTTLGFGKIGGLSITDNSVTTNDLDVKISGGTSCTNCNITFDASGRATAAANGSGSGTAAGNNTNIQYNNGGTTAGSDNFIWNNTGQFTNIIGSTTTSTSAVERLVLTTNTTSAGGGIGLGSAITFRSETANTGAAENVDQCYIKTGWTNPDNATRTAKMEFYTDSTAVTPLRLQLLGTSGVYGVKATSPFRADGQIASFGSGSSFNTTIGSASLKLFNKVQNDGWILGTTDAGDFLLTDNAGFSNFGIIKSTGNARVFNKLEVNTLGTTATKILGRNTSNEVADVTIGAGLSLTSGTLSAATGSTTYTCTVTSGEGSTATNSIVSGFTTVTATVNASGAGITFGIVNNSSTLSTWKFVIPSGVTLYSFRLACDGPFPGTTTTHITVNLKFDNDAGYTQNTGPLTAMIPSLRAMRTDITNGGYCYPSSTTSAIGTGSLETTLQTVPISGDITFKLIDWGQALGATNAGAKIVVFGDFNF